ncbi:hypothetical protein SIL08_05235 [Scandinavium sp. V105_16]|uniref:Uncharacterized protein n=1 Tax=Scandinavium lactucae TaxID=3095028 RepID=A0ABU4QNZ1_9ENTR|nr:MULTISPECIES: hypothetical protein [unclassified Scandinavium]MDX6019695.1 hypothetical protein [Scandinavium sp. V105_16]MDX6040089.1 hypothetical protein [Scandinavium sp. V105_6]
MSNKPLKLPRRVLVWVLPDNLAHPTLLGSAWIVDQGGHSFLSRPAPIT